MGLPFCIPFKERRNQGFFCSLEKKDPKVDWTIGAESCYTSHYTSAHPQIKMRKETDFVAILTLYSGAGGGVNPPREVIFSISNYGSITKFNEMH